MLSRKHKGHPPQRMAFCIFSIPYSLFPDP